jgi:hypothetical protein
MRAFTVIHHFPHHAIMPPGTWPPAIAYFAAAG